MPDLSAQSWQQRYEEGQTGWDRGQSNPMLQEWLESRALTPCRIAVPGCGRGHEVLALAQQGFEVTGIDFAVAPVEFLRQNLAGRGLGAEVVQADLFAYEPEVAFEAVYEQTCLCAIDPRMRTDYVARMHRWLQPGGQLFILFMQCDTLDRPGPPFHCDMDEMRSLFPQESWNWPDEEPTRVDHPGSVYELATVLIAR